MIGYEQLTHEPRSLHHEVDVLWTGASGWEVYSGDKIFIDFTSGIFVANIGHNHPHVALAIRQQTSKLLHTYVFPNQPRIDLVNKLVEMTGFEKVFLCSTGSEAVEAALRCMWAQHRIKWEGHIMALKNANHGRTYGANHRITKSLDYNSWPQKGDSENVSGLLFESYLGYNAQFHPVEWVQEWCSWAKDNHIPVCFDEVQAGFGRTGKLFGYEHYGVRPNLITIGKALSGSLPIAAVLGDADLLDAPDDLSSTHTGNPVCCAAALANLRVLEDEGLVERAASLEPMLRQRLTEIQTLYPEKVKKVVGKGMIWALDLEDIDMANRVVERCAESGLLLVKTHRGTIKIGMPLITPEDIIEKGLKIMEEAIGDF